MSSHVRRDESDGVVTITFTRDDKRNAVDREMWDALEHAVEDLESRRDLRVLVITAEGRYFTSGMDIALMLEPFTDPSGGFGHGQGIRRVYRRAAHHDFFDRMEQVEKPIILAAQSHCLGVGLEMGVSCDFRLASDAATFMLPEVPNLAVLPASGGISRLTRLVGPGWARWIAMAGETIGAHQALEIGLVQAVYPAAEFDERVQAFARRLAAMPPEALGLAKLAIDTADSVDRRTARDFDRVAQTLLFQSPEFEARMRSLLGPSAPAAEK